MYYHHRPAVIVTLMITTFLLVAASGWAASLKDRMEARLPAIVALKDQGIIGENANGYLEYRTGNKPEQKLIQEENNDRRAVYADIAGKQGVDPALVGQRRAKQLAERGSAGHWFRRADGSWYQK